MKALIALTALAILSPGPAWATPFFFSTGTPDALMAAASRAPSTGKIEIEAADDFQLPAQITITGATFAGLLPTGTSAAAITRVVIKFYRIFPTDSMNPPSGTVPTRVNSPADVALASRDSAAKSLKFVFGQSGAGFAANNSVLNGINPVPNQTTGGEGAVAGEIGQFNLALSPVSLPAGQYFFVAQVTLTSGNFFWLSSPRPIAPPGTPFLPDLQAWIRNTNLSPNWLRIGTDILGSGQYDLAFAISGDDDLIFGSEFED